MSAEILLPAPPSSPRRMPVSDRGVPPAPPDPPPKLLDQLRTALRTALRTRHYSPRTVATYAARVRRYVIFAGRRHPRELGPDDVRRCLSALAVHGRVSASTQNQALAALALLYRDLLGTPLGSVESVVRAKRPVRVPTVLGRDEVRAVLGCLEGTPRLVALLLYGSGLRLLESLRLRVKDADLARGEVAVRGATTRVDERRLMLRRRCV